MSTSRHDPESAKATEGQCEYVSTSFVRPYRDSLFTLSIYRINSRTTIVAMPLVVVTERMPLETAIFGKQRVMIYVDQVVSSIGCLGVEVMHKRLGRVPGASTLNWLQTESSSRLRHDKTHSTTNTNTNTLVAHHTYPIIAEYLIWIYCSTMPALTL